MNKRIRLMEPLRFDPMDKNNMRELFPHAYSQYYGGNVLVLPTLATSVEAAKAEFLKKHECDYVSYKASRDQTGKRIPIQMIQVEAYCAKWDQAKVFLVDKSRYANNVTYFGYVVDMDVDVFVVDVDVKD